jgi:hypothetical protein
MLNLEAQQRAREALRRADQALAALVEAESNVQKQADTFRENVFSAVQFLENESMTLQELQIQARRPDKNQLQVQSRGRQPFALIMNAEPAYDIRPAPAGQATEAPPQSSTELAARMFAVFLPPNRGLLRYYTIFADGAWKRTTFVPTSGGVQTRSTLVPRATPDVLILEAVDLINYAFTVHATWDSLAAEAETMTVEAIQDRTRVKAHASGLGTPRSGGKAS